MLIKIRKIWASRISFSLIELLVVIAVISLLASMLLPALSGAREKARQIKCISNLKNIGLAVQMYTDDNDGWFPTYASSFSWMSCYTPYISKYSGLSSYYQAKKKDIMFHCPSATAADSWNGTLYSYGYNEYMQIRPPHSSYRKKIGRVKQPGEAMLLIDAAWPTMYSLNAINTYLSPRHSDGANLLFVDGHCKWYSATEIKALAAKNVFWYGY